MLIPHQMLEAETLTRLLEDFVTREAPTMATTHRWRPASSGRAGHWRRVRR